MIKIYGAVNRDCKCVFQLRTELNLNLRQSFCPCGCYHLELIYIFLFQVIKSTSFPRLSRELLLDILYVLAAENEKLK